MEYSKVNDTTIRATKSVEIAEVVNTYDLDFLKQQEIAILRAKNDYIAARDRELDEVRTLIAECGKLGIKGRAEVKLAEEEIIP